MTLREWSTIWCIKWGPKSNNWSRIQKHKNIIYKISIYLSLVASARAGQSQYRRENPKEPVYFPEYKSLNSLPTDRDRIRDRLPCGPHSLCCPLFTSLFFP